MHNQGFKYKVGEVVTHMGFLKPIRQPTVQQFVVVTQTLVTGPGGAQRFYYIRPAGRSGTQSQSTLDTLRVQEQHLAPLPEDL
jgi:hypothetical protein